MRRAPFLLLFVIVLLAGLGFLVQSPLRGQGAAVSSTPPKAAAEPVLNENVLRIQRGSVEAVNLPAASTGPSYGVYYSSAGMAPSRRVGDAEAWQAQQEIANLLAKYAETSDEKERAKIKEGMSKLLARQFDLQQKERESEIADIEGRVKRLREMLDKRTKARQSIITNRLEQLLREAEGLGWVEPGPAGMRGMYPGMPGTAAGGMSGYGGGMYGGMGGTGAGSAMGSSGPARVLPTPPRPTPSSAKPAPRAAPKGSGSRDAGSKRPAP